MEKKYSQKATYEASQVNARCKHFLSAQRERETARRQNPRGLQLKGIGPGLKAEPLTGGLSTTVN